MENNIKTKTVENNRLVLQQFGQLYGRQLLTISSRNPDLSYLKDKQAGKNVLMRSYNILEVVAVNISKIELIEAVNGPAVRLNDDPNLQFRLAEPKFKSVTAQTVSEAVESYRADKTPTFFSDSEYPQLIAEVSSANTDAIRDLEDYAQHLMEVAASITKINDGQRCMYTDYMKQVGINESETNVEITISK